jgi:hypothetical protein
VWGGETRGRDAFFAMVTAVSDHFEAELDLVDAVAIGDEMVLCQYRLNGRVGNEDLTDQDCSMLFRFDEHGLIVSGVEMYSRAVDGALASARDSGH